MGAPVNYVQINLADGFAYANLKSVVEQVFPDGIFVLVARQQLIAELRTHLPFEISRTNAEEGFKTGGQIPAPDKRGFFCVVLKVG